MSTRVPGNENKQETASPEKPRKIELPPPVIAAVKETIKSKLSTMTIGGEEFYVVPKKVFKYMLFIPETIKLDARQWGDKLINDYPLPQDWGIGTEFYVNGIRHTFNELIITIKDEMKTGLHGELIPNFPRIEVHG